MFYSAQVKKACSIMYEAHKEDLDKGGYPYVFHPFYLASGMTDEDGVCVALLHDVIEDHGDVYSFASLEKAGFSPVVISALRLLIHETGVEYMDYVRKIAENPLARRVKIADLRHNLDASRMDGWESPKREVYREALSLLEAREEQELLERQKPVREKEAELSLVRGKNYDWYSAMSFLILITIPLLLMGILTVFGHGPHVVWWVIVGGLFFCAVVLFILSSIWRWRNRGRQEKLEEELERMVNNM